MPEPLVIAKSGDTDIALLPGMANRHGCITGATGTGKTIALQVLAEQFSRIGVPVFPADVKGDLTGITKAGQMREKLGARLKKLGLPEPKWRGCPASSGPSGSAGAGTASSSGWASGGLGGLIFGTTGPRGAKHDGLIDLVAKSAARSAGSSISRSVLRGVLGSLAGGRR